MNILQQQSKRAAMGEMIGAIAHQWRQPLNELTIRIQKLKYQYKNDEINEAFLNTFIEKNKQTIAFMSHTIDNFRNFFRVDKIKKEFDIKTAIENVLDIQRAQLTNHNIEVTLKGETFAIMGHQTEFQQAVLNIIANAKDAIDSSGIKDGKITISFVDKTIEIHDNGGGIPVDILERVFEPYFTTKDEGKGTGMGLYITKMIIEDNMGAKLSAYNEDDGAAIAISF
jgi:signal transduction histidine kinase